MDNKLQYIYELRVYIDGQWTPFYVGTTKNPTKRYAAHKSAAKTDKQLLVYDAIRSFVSENLEWNLFPIRQFTPQDDGNSFENDAIIQLLRDGYYLTNMKKGSPNWMRERQQIAQDMNARGLPKGTTEKQYRALITHEENERKQQLLLAAEEERKQQEQRRAEQEQQQVLRDQIKKELGLATIGYEDAVLWSTLTPEQKFLFMKKKEVQQILDTYLTEKTAMQVMCLRGILEHYIPLNHETDVIHMDIRQSLRLETTEDSINRIRGVSISHSARTQRNIAERYKVSFSKEERKMIYEILENGDKQ